MTLVIAWRQEIVEETVKDFLGCKVKCMYSFKRDSFNCLGIFK